MLTAASWRLHSHLKQSRAKRAKQISIKGQKQWTWLNDDNFFQCSREGSFDKEAFGGVLWRVPAAVASNKPAESKVDDVEGGFFFFGGDLAWLVGVCSVYLKSDCSWLIRIWIILKENSTLSDTSFRNVSLLFYVSKTTENNLQINQQWRQLLV